MSKYDAIQNKRTKRYVVRTVQAGGRRVSVTEKDGALMYASREDAERDARRRGLGDDFEVVKIK